MGIDIAGVLKLIGGIKQLKVGSVFAEGTNIIKQSQNTSLIGGNSLLNTIGPLQTLFSNGGLSSVYPNNPVSIATGSLQGSLQNGSTSVGAITNTTTSTDSSGNTTSTTLPAYPLFLSALTTAESNLAAYYYMSQLLSGQAQPDYDNNEYGLSDVLETSASGTADLDMLVAPLKINANLTVALDQLTLLLQSVDSRQTADADAASQLAQIMSPITTSMQTSKTAYYQANSNDSASVIIGMSLSYLNGVPSPQSDLVQSLLNPSLVPLVLAQNQQDLAEISSNQASAQAQRSLQREAESKIEQQIKEIKNELDQIAGSRNQP